MARRLSILCAGLAWALGMLAGGLPAPAPALGLARVLRVGSAPPLTLGALVNGALPSSTPMHITVALKPRDPAGLAAYARAVSTPGSPLYHQFLSRREFARRFGARARAVDAVLASLRAHGLTPGAPAANGLSVPVSASAAQIAHAFSLSFVRVALSGHTSAVINSLPPALDADVASLVQGVVGLDTLATPHPLLRRAARNGALAGSGSLAASGSLVGSGALKGHVATGGPQPCPTAKTAAGSQHAYTADQLASAYGMSGLYSAGDQGAGQVIALYELEPVEPADIAAFQACYRTSASVTYVPVDGGVGSGAGSGEAALDIETAMAFAPKASFVVYQGPNAQSSAPGSGPYDTFSAIITQNRARVISVSWGQCEAQQGSAAASAESTLFQEAAVQGQSLLAAGGDSGSEDCTGQGLLANPFLAVDDPASQPFVTGVGGTSLTAPGPRPQEHVWNDGGAFLGILGGASGAGGGGISSFWGMPAYQRNAASGLHVISADSSGAPCQASSPCRQVPDVSADGDPATGYLIYFSGGAGGWQGVGGTSAAAPTWAAVLALTNASSACHGHVIGFANPALYAAAGRAYASVFNDVTTGDNDLTGLGGGRFAAGGGYDMASGLGSPNAAALAAALCSASAVTPKSPPAHRLGAGPRGPHLSAASLTGVGKRRPRLSFTLTAATGTPALRSVQISLPGSLRFTRHARGVSVASASSARARYAAGLAAGAFVIRLRTSAAWLRVRVAYPRLVVHARHLRGRVKITLLVTSAKRTRVRLTVTIAVRQH